MRASRQLIATFAALLALCVAIDSALAADPPTDHTIADLFQPAGLDNQGDLRIHLNSNSFTKLKSAHDQIDLQLPVGPDRTLALKLHRFEVFTPQSQFIRAGRQGQTAMQVPQVILLRGHIEGDPGSHAFLSFTSNGSATGLISTTAGEHFQIVTLRDAEQPGTIIVRRASDALPGFDQLCMTIDARSDQGGIAGGGGGGSPPDPARGLRVLTIAIDADQSFTQLFDSLDEAQAYIVQLIAAVSDIYIRDLNFKIILNFSRLWPDGNEPFSAASLSGFRDYWIQNEELSGLNLVHLLSGRRNLSYGGIAYLTDACSGFAFGISGFLLGGFPSPVVQPHLSNWDVVVVAHEIGHNLGTLHTHDLDPPIDTCAQGSNQRGTIMSYCHTRMGGLLNIDMRFHSGNIDIITENNADVECLWHDCNANGIDDADDIAADINIDSDHNLIPDQCEDCNGNAILDSLDIANGAPDINANSIPDSCEPDCNGNLQPDPWEVAHNLADDENGDLIPDDCQPDCTGNKVFDYVDILHGDEIDLDRNSAPDSCQDCNANGQPDWIDVDREFNLFVGQSTSSLREYHAASGVLISDVGAGLVNGAYDLVFGPDRQLYVASFNDNRIVRINVDTGIATTFVPAGIGGLSGPSSLTFGPNGNLFVASQANNRIIEYHGQTGQPLGAFIAGGANSLTAPWDIAFGPNGNLFVVSSNNRILQFNGSTGEFINVFVSGHGEMNDPRGLVFLPSGEMLLTNRGANTVTHYSSTGLHLGKFNDEYNLQRPWGITIGPNGNLYVASTADVVRLIEYDVQTGRYIRSFIRGDGGLTVPTSFAFRPSSPNDVNANSLPDSCDLAACPSDIAPTVPGDSQINVLDLLTLIQAWGPCPACPADLNADAEVNVADLTALIDDWGPCSN